MNKSLIKDAVLYLMHLINVSKQKLINIYENNTSFSFFKLKQKKSGELVFTIFQTNFN